jgi:hypothetical protein
MKNDMIRTVGKFFALALVAVLATGAFGCGIYCKTYCEFKEIFGDLGAAGSVAP